jgi:hypothetical protein
VRGSLLYAGACASLCKHTNPLIRSRSRSTTFSPHGEKGFQRKSVDRSRLIPQRIARSPLKNRTQRKINPTDLAVLYICSVSCREVDACTNNHSIQGMRFERDEVGSGDAEHLSFEGESNSKAPSKRWACSRVDRERMSGAKSRLEPQRRGIGKAGEVRSDRSEVRIASSEWFRLLLFKTRRREWLKRTRIGSFLFAIRYSLFAPVLETYGPPGDRSERHRACAGCKNRPRGARESANPHDLSF